MNYFSTYYGKSKGACNVILDRITPLIKQGWIQLNCRYVYDHKPVEFIVETPVYIDRFEKLPCSPTKLEFLIKWNRTPGEQGKFVTFIDFIELRKKCELKLEEIKKVEALR